MEFDFLLPGVEGLSVHVWDRTSIARLSKVEREALHKVIDAFGRKSAAAQGLPRPVTDSVRLRSTDQSLYLLCEKSGKRRTRVLGGLKTGRKKLFLRQIDGSYDEIMPTCILDFYVHERCQRQGLGLHIFKEFLIHERETASTVGYDRPSGSFLKFLDRHFGLSDYVPQANNFVVFNDYFREAEQRGITVERKRVPASFRTSSPSRPGSGLRRRAFTPSPIISRSSSQNSMSSATSLQSHKSCRGAAFGGIPRSDDRPRSRANLDGAHSNGIRRTLSHQPDRRSGASTPETPNRRHHNYLRASAGTPPLKGRRSAPVVSPVHVPRAGFGVLNSPSGSITSEDQVRTPIARSVSAAYVPPSRQLMGKSSSLNSLRDGPNSNRVSGKKQVLRRNDSLSGSQISSGPHGLEGVEQGRSRRSGVAKSPTPVSEQYRCVPPWAVDPKNDRIRGSSVEPPEDRKFSRSQTSAKAQYAGSGVGNCLLWV
ncbi:hypothetical protein BSKO_08269 [Bryopsis sp. KO-2023]|nr:hypothetical protein BSKO_08269 [Bryopsis sp. KO-2023]